MKAVIKDFLKFSSNVFLILILIFSSFLLLVNFFHYKESEYKYFLSDEKLQSSIDYKKNILDLRDKVNSINFGSISNKNAALAFGKINFNINKCLDVIEKSDFYSIDSLNYIDYKITYKMNDDMKNNISNECLFVMNYNINNILNDYSLTDSNYNFFNDNIVNKKKDIDFMSKYLEDKLLSNSSYNFSSDTVRSTIYNDLENDYSLILKNYNTILDNVKNVTSWYLDYFGGMYDK